MPSSSSRLDEVEAEVAKIRDRAEAGLPVDLGYALLLLAELLKLIADSDGVSLH
jgi:hypothetical protein